MNYEALVDLWRKQNELFERWRKDLLENAENLRAHVEKALGAPTERWEDPDTRKKYRYIEITDMFEAEAPDQAASDGGTSDEKGLSRKSMTENMELVFGISIALGVGANGEHRSIYNLPVAIRYLDNELEYSLFDPVKVAFIEWEDSIDQFTESIFNKIEEYFSFNPYAGPRGDLEVGFLKKH